jgi:hypothetical protein
MHFRFRYRQLGGHVHVRLFTGEARERTHDHNGTLAFREDEWRIFVGLHQGDAFEFVHEDEPLEGKLYDNYGS